MATVEPGKAIGQDKGMEEAGFLSGIPFVGEYLDEYLTGRRAQKKDFEYSLALQKAQNEEEWKMLKWKYEQDSTANQLKRWMEAGGNPNAFFNNQSGATPAPQGTASGLGSVGSTIGQLQQGINQGAKLYWEVQNLKEDATHKGIENGTLRQMNELKMAEIQATIDKLVEEKDLTKEKANEIRTLLPLTANKTEAEIKQIQGQIGLMMAQTKQAIANARYLDQRRRTEVYNTEKAKWEQAFRDTYGIDPNSNDVQAIIQTILGGHGEEIFGQLFNFVTEAINGITIGISNNGESILEKARRSIIYAYDKVLHPNETYDEFVGRRYGRKRDFHSLNK